jgi:hypothetical protein
MHGATIKIIKQTNSQKALKDLEWETRIWLTCCFHYYTCYESPFHPTTFKCVVYRRCHVLRPHSVGNRRINEHGTPVEWHWEETKVLGAKPIPVPFLSPQIPRSLNWDWTRVFAVTGRQLNAWTKARSYFLTTKDYSNTYVWMWFTSIQHFVYFSLLILTPSGCSRNWRMFWRELTGRQCKYSIT